MPIRYTLPVRELHDRLSRLRETRPGAATVIDECASAIDRTIEHYGQRSAGGDRLRELEAVIYGYLLAGNPGDPNLHPVGDVT